MLYLVQFGDLLESRDEFMLYLNLEKSSCYIWYSLVIYLNLEKSSCYT